MANIGLVSLSTSVISHPKTRVVNVMLSMMRHEPILAPIRTAAPMTQARKEVSPIDPGMVPRKASHRDVVLRAPMPSAGTLPSGVAKE